MSECKKQRQLLVDEFKQCKKIIIAIGDETRQSIIMTLLESHKIGLRVGEITEKTHLSRPAVSHHLQILKNAKVIDMRRKGTMNFYYMNANQTEWGKLTKLISHIDEIIKVASESNYPNNYLGGEDDD